MSVDILKGVNMAFRRSIFPLLDQNLQSGHSEGNGSHWEIDVCMTVTKQGYSLLFDPSLDVRHHSNHSHFIHEKNMVNNARNLTYVILKHFSILRKFKFLFYTWFIGNSQIIGLVKYFQLLYEQGPFRASIDYYLSVKGHIKGLVIFWKSK